MFGRLLNVGAGGDPLPPWVTYLEEVRVDINPDLSPNLVADMRNLGDIGEYDTVYSSHALEHLNDGDAEKAIAEFCRVLKRDGVLLLFIPDIQDVEDDDTILFVAPAGPIRGRDLHHGHEEYTKRHEEMKHLSTWDQTKLQALLEKYFSKVVVSRVFCYNLFAVGVK